MHYDTSMHHSNVLSSVYMCTCVQTVPCLVLGGVQVELRVPIIMRQKCLFSLLAVYSSAFTPGATSGGMHFSTTR